MIGCSLNFSPDVGREAFEKVYSNETTAMYYLAKRRNDIAHGSTNFEDGAFDMTIDDLERLALRIIPFLREVSVSYQTYLDGRVFILQAEKTA